MSNKEQWQSLLSELDRRQSIAEALGGQQRVERQHQRGRLTARERLYALFDTGSFNEIGALAGGEPPPDQAALAGDGLVGGVGRIEGHAVIAMAEDFTVKGGSIGHVNAAKRARLVRLASERKLPLVMMLDGAGERATNTNERYPNTPNDLQLLSDLSGQVPIIAIVMGSSAGHGALCAMFADIVIMVEGSALFTAGPPLVQTALGTEVSAESLGGVELHTAVSGVAHNSVIDDASACDLTRRLLVYLSDSANESASSFDYGDAGGDQVSLLELIPTALNAPYDMRLVVSILADADSIIELQPLYGRSLLVCLARFGGRAVMVVANQPNHLSGAITVDAAKKATHFIDVADQRGLPLLMLLDNPGVMPGAQSEQAGILRAAASMFAAQRRYQGQKLVVTVRKAFGFGSSVMGMNPWDRQAISLALPTASLGGMPVIGGDAVARVSAEERQRMAVAQAAAWVPADAMAFDKVVSPLSLRQEITEALAWSVYGTQE